MLKEGPGAQLATEDPGHSSERQGAARTATPSRGRARASSEPPPQTEEGAPAGEEGPRAPSADPPARGRRKIVFGSSKLLLLASVAQADNANWANLSQALLEANASGTEKAETLERLRQLAESRRVSRLGLEEAARQERARVAQAAEEEERYRAGLNPELQRLERANPVGPRQGEPILTNNRLQADVEAGVPIWVARRRHRARERAAKHQAEQAKVGAPPLNSAGSEQRNPGEGGKGLGEDLDAAARRELREFRRTLLQQEGGAQSLRRQPESQARKKRRREERKAKAKAGAPSGAASSLAAVAIAALPSGADAFSPLLALLWNPVPPHAFVVGALLLCVMVTLLTVGAVARFAPGPTKGGRLHNGSIHKGTRRALALLLCWSLVPVAGSEEREPSTPGEQRWDLIYFFFLVGLASVGGASLLMRLVHMLTPRETKDSWTQTTPSEDQGTHSTRLPLRISVTASGDCYHEPGCNHLRGRKARAYRPCLDCLDLPPDLQRTPSPSRTSGSGTRRKQGSRDGGSHRVWGESSSSRTHHPYAQPLLPENLVATPAMVVLLTLAIVGMAMLLQGCGTDLRFSVLSSEASFSPGTKDPRRAGASVRFEDSGPLMPPTRKGARTRTLTPTPVTVPFVGGPSKAKQLYPDNKELRVAPLQGGKEWKAETLHLLLARLAETTQKSYLSQWRWWELFCARRGTSPWRRVSAYSALEEDLFVQYVVHCGVNSDKAPGTVKGRLAAIRAFHITSGLPDPFAQLPRVALVVAGLKKRYGTKERRRPVTPEMLRWLYTHLHGGTLDQAEAALQWGALCLAFFFLLRASEYLDTGYHSPLRGLRGRDLKLTREGKPCSLGDFEDADELTVFIRGSKTDVYNRGEYRNHYKTGLLLCPVKAAVQLFRAFPLRFAGGSEEEELLFRDAEGRPLPRALVSTLIRKAAEALGEPEGALGTHSLRFGGASALWAAFGDAALVKRWGRWTSESFQTYIWDARATSRDVAKKMALTDLTPR